MEQNILDKISQGYDLSKLALFDAPKQGVSGRNTIVKTEDGRLFFLKNYKKTDADRRKESELVELFASQDKVIPVILPLKNKDGQSHTIIDGQIYSLFPYIEQRKDISNIQETELMRILGEMLGKIHAVSKKYPLSEAIQPISSWETEGKERSIEDLNKIKELIKNKTVKDDYDEKASAFIELKLSLLSQNNFSVKDNEPVAICHGDYHKGNILFDDSGIIIGVCDWDISGKANPYVEFIRSFNMCVVRRNFDNYKDNGKSSKSFIDGYRSSCGFEFDLSELDYAIEQWYQKILSMVWPLSDHYYWNHAKTDSFVDSETKKILFLKDNRNQLLAHIKSCL